MATSKWLGVAAAMVLSGIPAAFAGHGFTPDTLVPICDLAYEGDTPEQRALSGAYAREHECCFPEAVPNDEQGGCGTSAFFRFLRNVINFLTLRLAPILVAIFVVAGGFVILTSAGNAERYSRGKRMITVSLIGAAIALAAFLIINAIFLALTGGSFGEFKLP